jgi:hypothetical protein
LLLLLLLGVGLKATFCMCGAYLLLVKTVTEGTLTADLFNNIQHNAKCVVLPSSLLWSLVPHFNSCYCLMHHGYDILRIREPKYRCCFVFFKKLKRCHPGTKVVVPIVNPRSSALMG